MAVPDLRDPDKEPWDSERMKNLLSITNPVGGRKSFKSRHFWAQILCPFWYVVAAASEMQDTLWKHIVLPTCNVTCAGEWWLCLFPQLHRAKGPVLIASSLQSSALCTVGTYLMLVELASQWVDCYQTAGHATVASSTWPWMNSVMKFASINWGSRLVGPMAANQNVRPKSSLVHSGKLRAQ